MGGWCGIALEFKVITSGFGVFKRLERKIACLGEKPAHTVAVQVQKDTEPYTPMNTGNMDNRTKVAGDTVVYPGPQSRYLYYGKLMVDPETGSAWASKGASKVVTDKDLVFKTDRHAQAQSHWFEASKAQNMDKWLRVAKKAVENELKQ